jgi:hypothetical protein
MSESIERRTATEVERLIKAVETRDKQLKSVTKTEPVSREVKPRVSRRAGERATHLLASTEFTTCGREASKVRVTVDITKMTCELCQGRTNAGWADKGGMHGKLSCHICGRLIRDHAVFESCIGGRQ